MLARCQSQKRERRKGGLVAAAGGSAIGVQKISKRELKKNRECPKRVVTDYS
jgi:hypothetical protein